MQYRVCSVKDIPPGDKREYTIKNIPILVVHSQQGNFYALYGICPHQRCAFRYAALGGLTTASQAGNTFHYQRAGEILRCAWHGFSFDVTTGACLTAPGKLRVKTYPVTIQEQEIFLEI